MLNEDPSGSFFMSGFSPARPAGNHRGPGEVFKVMKGRGKPTMAKQEIV